MIPIVVLLSDFQDEYYHGVMKGKILQKCRNAQIVDLPIRGRFDPLATAWVLLNTISYYPPQTVFVAVVDPGVGTERRPLLLQWKNQYFIAPDNGVLSPFISENSRIFELTVIEGDSSTFHGRDIFSPAAGLLAQQIQSEDIELDKLGERLSLKEAVRPISVIPSSKVGQVVYVDVFGNIVTNIRPKKKQISQTVYLQIEEQTRSFPFSHTFADKDDEIFLIVGSCDTLEIVKNQGSAYEELEIGIGTEIKLL